MQQACAATRTPTDRFNKLRHMIGNTPLLGIHFNYRGKRRVIYAKAEHMNMTGSISAAGIASGTFGNEAGTTGNGFGTNGNGVGTAGNGFGAAGNLALG